VSLVTDRHSGENKGFGYVRYHRAYHAALALEGCDQGQLSTWCCMSNISQQITLKSENKSLLLEMVKNFDWLLCNT
jgi:hypothetical protein